MSFDIQAWAIKQKVGSATEKAVLWVLSDRASEDNGWECWPSVATIAESCGMADSTVRDAINGLVARGLIAKVGKTHRRHYRLLVPQIAPDNGGVAPDGGESGENDCADTRRGSAARRRRSAGSRRQTSKEPIINQSGVADAPPRDDAADDARQARRDDKRGTRLSEDWQPSPDDIAFAERHPTVDWRLQADRFRNYWLARAGNAARKTDWARTWQNWILNEACYAAERGARAGRFASGAGGQGSAPTGSPEEIWQTRVERFKASGFWLQSWGPRPGEKGCRVVGGAP